jgi:hypothetical protein
MHRCYRPCDRPVNEVSDTGRAVVSDGWVVRAVRTVVNGRSQPHSDGVFVAGNVSATTQAQYERLWYQVRRAKRVLFIGSALVFAALLIATARGAAGWTSWLILLLLLVLGAVCHVIDLRLARRPPGSVEVPENLVDAIVELQEARDDIIEYGPDQLPPAEYERVVDLVVEQVAAIVAAAARAFEAERADDLAESARIRMDIQERADVVMDLHQSVVEGMDDEDDVPMELVARQPSMESFAEAERPLST